MEDVGIDRTCAICLQELTPGEDLVSPSRSGRHLFHFGCLSAWLRQSTKDPITREKYL